MTEEEYERLRESAHGQGARSVSDYARTTLLAAPQPHASAAPNWCQTLSSLTDRISKVEDDVALVKKTLL